VLLGAYNGHEEVVGALLAAGSPSNIPNNFGSRALNEAAAQGYKSIVEMLIETGADVNAPDNVGNTPLIMAAYNDRTVRTHHGDFAWREAVAPCRDIPLRKACRWTAESTRLLTKRVATSLGLGRVAAMIAADTSISVTLIAGGGGVPAAEGCRPVDQKPVGKHGGGLLQERGACRHPQGQTPKIFCPGMDDYLEDLMVGAQQKVYKPAAHG
jgi:hypothetical protein